MTKPESATFVAVGIYRPLERLVGVIKRKLDRTAKRSRLNQQRTDRLEYFLGKTKLDWVDFVDAYPVSGLPSQSVVSERVQKYHFPLENIVLTKEDE